MAIVLSKDSIISCAHKGRVSLAGSPKLTVARSPVLLLEGLVSQSIDLCPVVDNPDKAIKQCRKVASANGTARKLTVGGKPVVIATVKGVTDGTPAPVDIGLTDAVHKKLRAI